MAFSAERRSAGAALPAAAALPTDEASQEFDTS